MDILCIERLFEELGDFRASTLIDKQADETAVSTPEIGNLPSGFQGMIGVPLTHDRRDAGLQIPHSSPLSSLGMTSSGLKPELVIANCQLSIATALPIPQQQH